MDEGLLEVFAWCIMDNHVHLVVRVSPDLLEIVFKRLNIKYAMYYHRKMKSVGHVFQSRFKSEVVESEASLINVIRYVYNNPVVAKMVSKAEDYLWSSYWVYLSGMIDETMSFVWRLFEGNADSFVSFHAKEDEYIYLDTAEDMEARRGALAQKAISKVCSKYSIFQAEDIYHRRVVFEEVIGEVKRLSGLSNKKIANLVGVSESRVQKALARQRDLL